MKLVQYNEQLVNTVTTVGLVRKHQANSSHSVWVHTHAFQAVHGLSIPQYITPL